MIMMLGLLGLRLSSIISLNIEDVDIETGLLQITEKGGKQRSLMIMPEILCFILDRYFIFLDQKQDPLFLSIREKRISPQTLQDIFLKATDSLDIDKHLHAHLFRHTAATHLNKVSDPEITVENYASCLLIIKNLMGHSTTRSTEIYIHPSMQKVRLAMEKLPGVIFMKELVKKEVSSLVFKSCAPSRNKSQILLNFLKTAVLMDWYVQITFF